jgi:hypothetical protein
VIGVSVEGVDKITEKLRKMPTSIDRRTIFEEAAQTFAARLRAATPDGYNQKLRDSVIYQVSDESAEVGYEAGVETAGNPDLDSVTRPKTKGRSVLRKWVQAGELESVLEETFDSYAAEAVTLLEEKFADGIS